MDFYRFKEYLEGKLAREKANEVRAWISDTRNDAMLRQWLGQLWAKSDILLHDQQPDFKQMLNRLHHKMDLHHDRETDNRRYLQIAYQYFSKVAAILIIPLLVGSVYFFVTRTNYSFTESRLAEQEIYVKPGTRLKITLPDGSDVWLNDGTTFRYPEVFSGKERRVFVDGEAFFKVKSSQSKPFVVENPMANTVVTGTTFNLNAYSVDGYFEATLSEGAITLEKDKRIYRMTPGMQLQYQVAGNYWTERQVNPADASAWVDGRLVFRNETLGKAILRLGRWYNVSVVIKDEELNDYRITATLEDEKLEQSLRLITLAIPVRYELKREKEGNHWKDTVYLMKK